MDAGELKSFDKLWMPPISSWTKWQWWLQEYFVFPGKRSLVPTLFPGKRDGSPKRISWTKWQWGLQEYFVFPGKSSLGPTFFLENIVRLNGSALVEAPWLISFQSNQRSWCLLFPLQTWIIPVLCNLRSSNKETRARLTEVCVFPGSIPGKLARSFFPLCVSSITYCYSMHLANNNGLNPAISKSHGTWNNVWNSGVSK